MWNSRLHRSLLRRVHFTFDSTLLYPYSKSLNSSQAPPSIIFCTIFYSPEKSCKSDSLKTMLFSISSTKMCKMCPMNCCIIKKDAIQYITNLFVLTAKARICQHTYTYVVSKNTLSVWRPGSEREGCPKRDTGWTSGWAQHIPRAPRRQS